MSIEVRIPKEITEYKEKILFGLSIRQLICFSSAILLCVGTYILLVNFLGLSKDIVSYIVIIEAMPLLAAGFIKKNGLTFEKYAKLFLKHKFGTKKRTYKTELLIDDKEDGNVWFTEKKRKSEKIRECEPFKITAAERKRNIKETKRKIKKAREEFKQRTKEKIKNKYITQDSTTDSKIRQNV